VARHLTLGHSPQALIARSRIAVLREDAGFMRIRCWRWESGNSARWGDTDEGRHISSRLPAIWRPIHRPNRAFAATADIARRLMRVASYIKEVGSS